METTIDKREMDAHQLLKNKELEILYKQARVTLPAALAAAWVYIIAIWLHDSSIQILIHWIAILTLVSAVRYQFIRIYSRSTQREEQYQRWFYGFLLGTTISGLMWGLLTVLIFPLLDINYKALTVLAISGLAGGSIGMYATSRAAFLCYTSTSMLPLCFVLLWQEDVVLRSFGILIALYYVFIAISMFRLNVMVKDGVNLQFENIDLLHQLEHEKETIAAMNQELELDIEKRKDTEKELLHAKNKAEGLADALSMLSVKDALTDITNRRGFDEYLANAWNRAIRNRSPISLIMCDVDYFKNYNDHYGHPRGDDVLKKIAAAIDNRVRRGSDLVARYGGEEFAIILPDAKIDQAYNIADQIRLAVKNLGIPHEKSSIDDHVTISLGVASVIPNLDLHSPDLIEQADQALYSAKAAGRNQVFPEISQDKVAILDTKN